MSNYRYSEVTKIEKFFFSERTKSMKVSKALSIVYFAAVSAECLRSLFEISNLDVFYFINIPVFSGEVSSACKNVKSTTCYEFSAVEE